ncbi:hypothetical protein G9A89_010453 [Geosiphon pyriformis]|nr:hypothetical protein G9A89_010453 [Geosiphon pyriformis]
MYLNWTVIVKEIPIEMSADAVHTAMSEYGLVVLIKMQLVGLWQKAVVKFGKTKQTDLIAACEKTCAINHHPIMYAWIRCAVVCFDLAESLNAVMGTIPVVRGAYFHWSHLVSAVYAKCGKSGHISLDCVFGRKFSSGGLSYKVFSDANKSRLAAIYAKYLALVAHFVSFGGVSWTQIANKLSFLSFFLNNSLVSFGFSLKKKPIPLVSVKLNNRFATLECSFTNLTEQVNKLAKKLDAFGPTVFQPSSGCQPLVILLSQN